ncbi:general odorant-binding protein 72-like isoform X2 [Periplaneta americana]|uniref:general odorant-binding protein 72-like isoform X2 n=1 Tax=Periplaneta americana TaxID=6978 RepID=UPI0037E763E0
MNLLHSFCLVAIISVLAVLRSTDGMTMDQVRQAGKMMRGRCLSKTGANPDIVEAASKGQFAADDKDLKCYMKCVMGMMQSVKGAKYNADVAIALAKKMLPDDVKDRSVAAIEKCRIEWDGHDDPCESSYAVTVCTYEADPEVFYFP